MQLPVDVKAVVEEAMNIERARATELSVTVYIDDDAPADLAEFARRAFEPLSPAAHVRVLRLDPAFLAPNPADDIACIVAGASSGVGAAASALRRAGVPVLVATTLPEIVAALAEAEGHPIPEGDIAAPKPPAEEELYDPYEAIPLPAGASFATSVQVERATRRAARNVVDTARAAATATREAAARGVRGLLPGLATVAGKGKAPVSGEVGVGEPIALDERAEESLAARMGAWVVDACRDKRLAFALAFRFARRPLALDAVRSTSLQNAGVGFVMVIPGADMPVMTLNQAKMLLTIAAAYGEELDLGRVKELAALVGGAFACRAVARQLVAAVPALGWAVKAAIGYGGTFAMGRAAIEYFEGGASASSLVEAVAKARDAAVRVAEEKAPAGVREGVSSAAASIVAGVRSRIVAGSDHDNR